MGFGLDSIGDAFGSAVDAVDGAIDSAAEHTVQTFKSAASDVSELAEDLPPVGPSLLTASFAGPFTVDPRVASGLEDMFEGAGNILDSADGLLRGRGRQEAVTGPDGIDGGRRTRDVERVDDRTGDRLGGVGADFNSDAQGRELLDHYLSAGGETLEIVDDPEWTDYMRNQLGANDRGVAFDDQVINELQSGDLTVGRTGSFAGETTNGEGITGVNYLHGTNQDVGGLEYEIVGSRPGPNGTTIVETRLTWNDKIDMNGQYTSDRVKNGFAELITLGRAEGYELSITWNEEFVISP